MAATGHSWSAWTQTKAPTCTAAGEEKRTCSKCGNSETRTVSATGHSWGSWTQTKAPTCSTAGEEKRTCSKCVNTETRTVAATGHSWGAWTQTKAPTCSTAGEEKRTCSKCGTTETRTVAATGNHTWEETAPTCTQAGSKTCKVCGKKKSGAAALGHDWVHHEEEGHWRDVLTCRCGAVFYDYNDWYAHFKSFKDDEEEQENHGGYSGTGEWVVDKPAYDVCSRCGITKQ